VAILFNKKLKITIAVGLSQLQKFLNNFNDENYIAL
jgi:hypothetical protein